jgi:heme-degrading monooxygenase HmoA
VTVYTLGIWTVKPGHEDEFVTAWHEFAEQTSAEFPGATATLLRDRDQANRFISFGPWESLEQIARWRASDMFVNALGSIRPLLEDFSAHTMDVATSGRTPAPGI